MHRFINSSQIMGSSKDHFCNLFKQDGGGFKGTVSRKITGVKTGINPQVFL